MEICNKLADNEMCINIQKTEFLECETQTYGIIKINNWGDLRSCTSGPWIVKTTCHLWYLEESKCSVETSHCDKKMPVYKKPQVAIYGRLSFPEDK